MSKTITLDNFKKELEGVFAEFIHSEYEVRQKAVEAGAEVARQALQDNSPVDTGKYAKSWVVKSKKYPNHRYVGNTAVAHGVVRRKTKDSSKGEARQGVPLSNVLEYSEKSPYYGLIRNTFDNAAPQIIEAMQKELENI